MTFLLFDEGDEKKNGRRIVSWPWRPYPTKVYWARLEESQMTCPLLARRAGNFDVPTIDGK
jgi:hypothetical protein